MVQRQQNVSEPVSPFYIRTLLSLDTSIKNALADKDAKKKLTATKARALTAMKQKIKKALKEYESEVAKYQTVSVDSSTPYLYSHSLSSGSGSLRT